MQNAALKTEESLLLGGQNIGPGERKTVNLWVAKLYTHNDVTMPVHVIHGKKPGPRLFLSAALHGDEINGVEIIRRIIHKNELDELSGSLIAVPVVNAFAFLNQTRDLPDGRDLNRSFPGGKKGSLGARLARLFMDEVVRNSTLGIDFHTGGRHKVNLPHIRADLSDERTKELAFAFGTPVILNSNTRDGSLRQAVAEQKIPVLVYEGGEALRFDEVAIRAGIGGVFSVMKAMGMIPADAGQQNSSEPFVANSSRWIRAQDSGIMRTTSMLGKKVMAKESLGVISDPLGENEVEVYSPRSGVIICQSNIPLVNRGDGLFHIASFDSPGSVESRLEEFQLELESELNEEIERKEQIGD